MPSAAPPCDDLADTRCVGHPDPSSATDRRPLCTKFSPPLPAGRIVRLDPAAWGGRLGSAPEAAVRVGRAGVCLRGEENRRVRGRVGCARARRVRVGGARRAGVTRTRRRVRHPAEGGQSPLARPPVQPAPRSVPSVGSRNSHTYTVPGPPARAPRHLPARRTPGPARHGACATRGEIRSLTWPRSPPPCRGRGGEEARSAGGAARERGRRGLPPSLPSGLRRTAPSRPSGVLPHLRWDLYTCLTQGATRRRFF